MTICSSGVSPIGQQLLGDGFGGGQEPGPPTRPQGITAQRTVIGTTTPYTASTRRQPRSGQQRPAWPGNATNSHWNPPYCERVRPAERRPASEPGARPWPGNAMNGHRGRTLSTGPRYRPESDANVRVQVRQDRGDDRGPAVLQRGHVDVGRAPRSGRKMAVKKVFTPGRGDVPRRRLLQDRQPQPSPRRRPRRPRAPARRRHQRRRRRTRRRNPSTSDSSTTSVEEVRRQGQRRSLTPIRRSAGRVDRTDSLIRSAVDQGGPDVNSPPRLEPLACSPMAVLGDRRRPAGTAGLFVMRAANGVEAARQPGARRARCSSPATRTSSPATRSTVARRDADVPSPVVPADAVTEVDAGAVARQRIAAGEVVVAHDVARRAAPQSLIPPAGSPSPSPSRSPPEPASVTRHRGHRRCRNRRRGPRRRRRRRGCSWSPPTRLRRSPAASTGDVAVLLGSETPNAIRPGRTTARTNSPAATR